MSVLSTIRTFLSTRQNHLDDHMVLAHFNNDHPTDVATHSHFQTQIDALEAAPPGATGPTGPTGVSGVAGATGPAGASGAAYPVGSFLRATGVLGETIPRTSDMTNSAIVFSGTQTFHGIYLTAGTVVSSIGVSTATSPATGPTNQWFSLYSAALGRLAVTADDTTTAWAANTMKILTIAAPYTILTSGLYYIGIMVAAGTPPTVWGATNRGSSILITAPAVCGQDATNTGLTTPATAPLTAASLTAINSLAYCRVA